MVRTVQALIAIDLGFDPRAVVSADLLVDGRAARRPGRPHGGDRARQSTPWREAAGIGGGPLAEECSSEASPFQATRGIGYVEVDAVSPGLLRRAWRSTDGRSLLRPWRRRQGRTRADPGEPDCRSQLLERRTRWGRRSCGDHAVGCTSSVSSLIFVGRRSRRSRTDDLPVEQPVAKLLGRQHVDQSRW